MLYLVLLCSLVSLVSAVIAEDKEPAVEENGDVAVATAANDPVSLTDSELEDLKALAA